MRIYSFILGCICWLCFQADAIAQTEESSKIALIVAIGDYPASTGWQKISSRNDVPLVKSALMKQGFVEENILVLGDTAATKEGILNAIRNGLIGRAKSGGVAYFHFSGHGQQVADDNGDEIDGFDEAIVPINSPMRYVAGVYEGGNLIRDEELGAMLDETRKKLGPTGNLLAVIDACHSGTGTRGLAPVKARGTDVAMASSDYSAAHRGSKNTPESMDGLGVVSESDLAPMVAIFGAAPNQLNYETRDESGQDVGSLSYAFSKKFAEAGKNITYRGLFGQIKLEMSAIAPRQTPMIEGQLDQEILGGKIKGSTAYFNVRKWNDPGDVIVDGGWLQGFDEASVIGFYPPETRNPSRATPLTIGTIIKSGPLESRVTLEKDLSQEEAMTAWVYVMEQNFGDLGVEIQLKNLTEGSKLRDALNAKLAEWPIIKTGSSPEMVVVESGNMVQLLTSDDYLLAELDSTMAPELAADSLVRNMLAFAQAKFLRSIEIKSYDIRLDFELVPVKVDLTTFKEIEILPLASKMDATGNLRFSNGDGIRIKVSNKGDKSAYFTLLDIQPDNKVNVLIPGQLEEPVDYRIGPGKSITLTNLFVIGPPAGTEVFKIIATGEPIDLRWITSSKGQNQTKAASQNPFEKLFFETFAPETTLTKNGRTSSMGSVNLSIFSQVFIIE